jgi:flagellar motor switch protein FliM
LGRKTQMDQKKAAAVDRGREKAPGGSPAAYDFRNPCRLSREHIRKIEYLHSSVAKRLGVSLAGLVRDSVTVEVVEVKEINFDELMKSIRSPGATFTFGVEPVDGTGIIDIDLLLAFSLVDRLFGGTGEPLPEERELTVIEQNIVKKVAARVLTEAASAFSSLVDVRLQEPKYVPNLEFVNSPSFNESMVKVKMEITKGSLTAGISVTYPYVVFEPIVKMSRQKEDAAKKGGPNAETVDHVKHIVPLHLTATLPVSMIRFGELMNLDKGDVLILDTRVSDEVDVSVGKRRLLAGRPGKSRGNLAIKVTSVFTKGGS